MTDILVIVKVLEMESVKFEYILPKDIGFILKKRTVGLLFYWRVVTKVLKKETSRKQRKFGIS